MANFNPSDRASRCVAVSVCDGIFVMRLVFPAVFLLLLLQKDTSLACKVFPSAFALLHVAPYPGCTVVVYESRQAALVSVISLKSSSVASSW